MTWCIEAQSTPKKVKCFVEMTVTSDVDCTENDIKRLLEKTLRQLPIRVLGVHVTLKK